MVFDAHKLDISDEFKHAIEAIRAQDDKIRIILNKVDMIYQCMFITSNNKRNLSSIQADMMTHQQLMRVYGALLWSLSKILGNPEVGGYNVSFVHSCRALAPITSRWKMY